MSHDFKNTSWQQKPLLLPGDMVMERNTDERTQTALQREASDWLSHGNPNVFITLSFREPAGYKRAEKAFGAFAYGLKSALFGRKSKKRLSMVPIVEKYHEGSSYGALMKPAEGIHIHCLMQLPDCPANHMEVIRKLWVQSDWCCGDPNVYCPKGDGWFEVLEAEDDAHRVINYVLKTCATDTQAVLWKFVSFGR